MNQQENTWLLHFGLAPLPKNVIADCEKMTEEKKVKNIYRKEDRDQLFDELTTTIKKHWGISCLELYKKIKAEGKLPIQDHGDEKPMLIDSFRRYYCRAHRELCLDVPTRIEISYRLVKLGYTDKQIAAISTDYLKTAVRIKVFLKYPEYKHINLYDSQLKVAVKHAVKRFSGRF